MRAPGLIAMTVAWGLGFAAVAHAATLQVAPVTLSVAPEVRIREIVPHLGPKSRAFIAREAARGAASGQISIAATRSAIVAADLGASTSGDIDALVQAVMMQAAADAETDLEDQIAAMQAASKNKAALRAQKQAMARESAAPAAAPYTLDRYASGGLAGLQAQNRRLKAQADSLSELSQDDQLRLQLAMDRLQKLMETLSNLMKKSSDTAGAIIGNMK